MHLRVLVGVSALAIAAPGAAGAQPAAKRWFHSPSGNIECEVGPDAYCQTFTPPRNATLTANGRTTVCASSRCSIGNGPENATTLAYGRSLRIGRFRCSSSTADIRCIVIATGHGFAIARAGVRSF